jgi:hypothetical protein
MRWVLLSVAGVLGLGLVAKFLNPTPPSPVEVTATATQWRAIDWDDFPTNTDVVVSGDGAFRIRSKTNGPILVNAKNGVDLSSLARDGLEVKSAGLRDVHITLEAGGTPQ